ncbi:MAG TPA: hypothetical protein VF781_10685 [Solirubrobacteraceae bacterium]
MSGAVPSRPALTALAVADSPERWAALGFTVSDGTVSLDGLSIELGASGRGITGWTLTGTDGRDDIAGLPTTRRENATDLGAKSLRVQHPNSAIGVDHVVIVTPDFDATAAALEAAFMPLRRIRHAGERRQGFRRLGPAIMEIVEAPEARATHFWGLTVVVADLDRARERTGGHLSPARPAVQPGRRIATLAREAGLSTRLAFMDPEGQ